MLLFIVCAALLAVGGTALALTTDSTWPTTDTSAITTAVTTPTTGASGDTSGGTSGITAPAPTNDTSGSTAATSATIQSEKADYAPGSTVNLSGSGWQPGESVNIKVNDTYGASWSHNVDVTADASGNVTDSFYLPDWFVSDYDVTATGAQSGTATTSFTDGNLVFALATSANAAPSNLTWSVNWDQWQGTGGSPNNTCAGTKSTNGTANYTGNTLTSGSQPGINDNASGKPTGAQPTGTFAGQYTLDYWSSSATSTTPLTSAQLCQIGNNGGGTTASLYAHFKVSNQAPVAQPQPLVSSNEDTAKSITLTATDANAGDTLTFSVVTGPTKGTLGSIGAVTCSGTAPKTCSASVTYTPNGNYNGSDSFTFKANDGTADSNIVPVPIIVNPVNDVPVGNNDTKTMNEDGGQLSIGFGALASDVETSDANLTYDISAPNPSGSLSGTGSTRNFTPAANFNGTVTINYTVTDRGDPDNCGTPSATCDAAKTSVKKTVTIDVTAVDDNPVAVDDSKTVLEDANATTIDALANDTDVDGGPKSIQSVTQPTNGTVTLTNGGADLTYKPKADYCNGGSPTDDFNYTLNGGSTAKVAVTVTCVNDKPKADAQSVTTAEDTAKPITLTGSDPEGDNLTYSVVSDPSHGTLSGSGKNLTYTPAADYHGPDSFTFKANDGNLDSDAATVSIDVTSVNDAPKAEAQQVSTAEDTAKPITLTGSDPEGDNLTYSVVSGPSHGTLSGSGKNLTYTPNGNYNGPDSFDFKADDGNGGTDTATVTIDVKAVNDAPSAGNITGDSTADEGQSKDYSVAATDDDGDTLNYAWTVKSGAATITSGASTDKATVKFLDGPDNVSLQVVISDGNGGQVTKDLDANRISVANVAPTIALTGDDTADEGTTHTYSYTTSDPGDDTVTVATDCGTGNTKSAGPTADSFKCTFPDGPATANVTAKATDSDGASDTDDQQVTVDVVNVPPALTAAADQSSNEGASASFDLGSFADPGANDGSWAVDVDWGDGSAHDTFSATSAGALGSKSHAYADEGTGPYTVSVKVTDKDGEFDTKTFKVAVANVKPTISLTGDDAADEGTTHTYSYTVTDPGANDTHTPSVSCDVPRGTLVSGSDTYDAATKKGSFKCTFPDGPATANVTAKVTDSDGASDTDDQQVTVNVANVPPSITAPTNQTANEGESKAFDLGSFTDPGPDSQWAVDVDWGDGSAHEQFSAASADALGSKSHTYADNGTKTVTVNVTDKDGESASKTFTVNVSNANPNVTAPADDTGVEGSSKSFALGSFADPGPDGPWQVSVDWGDSSTPTTFSAASAGSLGSQSHAYADNGAYTVTVKVTDKDSGSSSATFKVTVTNVAPKITSFTSTPYFSGPLSFLGNTPNASKFSGAWTDPGADTWKADLSYQDGSPLTQQLLGLTQRSFSDVGHTFASAGCKSTSLKVTDDDLGSSDTATTTTQVGTAAFMAPMTNQPVTDKLKNGQVLPVKVKFTDCGGAPMTNLAPAIRLVQGDQTPTSDDSTGTITPGSVSAADTLGIMRSNGDGSYIYNMGINITLNKDYTVVVYPYGTDDPRRLGHVIQATK